jgi:hypothetical protein
MNNEAQATKEEIAESRRRCWGSNCKNTAIIEDKSGWRYCFKHYRYYRKHDGGHFTKMRKIIWKNLFKNKLTK